MTDESVKEKSSAPSEAQEISSDFKMFEPNETTYAAMEAAERGENLYGPFDTAEEMMASLNETAK